MKTTLTPGDKGSTDGINWVIGNDNEKYYIGSCGGCGYSYSTKDWHMADQSACRDCYPEGWGAVFAYDEADHPDTGNSMYLSNY